LVRPEFELAALAKVLPASLIGEVLEATGKTGKRRRKLPPELVSWLLIGMGLFRDLSIPAVLRRVVDGLTGVVSWGLAELPCATSVAHARDRLGWETVRELFRRFADQLLGRYAEAATWRGLAVYVLDGVCFLTPDSEKNESEFGRAGVTRGGAKSGFPQLRAVLLVAAWTHLVVRAAFGPYRKGELTLAHEMVGQIPPGVLLLLDRAYYSFAWLSAVLDRKASFVVRARTNGRCMVPGITKRFARGDALATLRVPACTKRKNPSLPDRLQVRVVIYTVKGYRPITLVTNLLEPTRYPAKEIAALYHDRWEAELAYREVKTYLVGKSVVFRSKTPNRVRQEAYGLLLAYNCVRALMTEAAVEAGVQPRRLSFVGCLERIRLALPLLAAAGNDGDRLLQALVDDLARCVLPPRRAGRQCPRAVKIKMSNYPRKRPGSQVVARTR
jgi:hypothetical protein